MCMNEYVFEYMNKCAPISFLLFYRESQTTILVIAVQYDEYDNGYIY